MLTSADVPNVCCAAVNAAVADVLTAVAAVPTAVDFLLLRMFQTSVGGSVHIRGKFKESKYTRKK